MSEWQPIKTCPKEEDQMVLLCLAVDGDPGDLYVDALYWVERYWMRRDEEILPSNHIPTHWMPLPDPPKSHKHKQPEPL